MQEIGKMKIDLYHGFCCSKLDKEEVSGDSVASILNRYVHENISLNGSCDVAVYKDEKWIGDYTLMKSIRCDVWLQKEPNKLNVVIENQKCEG